LKMRLVDRRRVSLIPGTRFLPNPLGKKDTMHHHGASRFRDFLKNPKFHRGTLHRRNGKKCCSRKIRPSR
jgi:hypothetical protein